MDTNHHPPRVNGEFTGIIRLRLFVPLRFEVVGYRFNLAYAAARPPHCLDVN
jgi:hypothetical protein